MPIASPPPVASLLLFALPSYPVCLRDVHELLITFPALQQTYVKHELYTDLTGSNLYSAVCEHCVLAINEYYYYYCSQCQTPEKFHRTFPLKYLAQIFCDEGLIQLNEVYLYVPS